MFTKLALNELETNSKTVWDQQPFEISYIPFSEMHWETIQTSKTRLFVEIFHFFQQNITKKLHSRCLNGFRISLYLPKYNLPNLNEVLAPYFDYL